LPPSSTTAAATNSGFDGQIDTLLNATANAVASVHLPQQLTLSTVTLVHIPDLVARAARPAMRMVLSNFVGERNASLEERDQLLEQARRRAEVAEETIRTLQSTRTTNEETEKIVANLQHEMDRMTQRANDKDEKMRLMAHEHDEEKRMRVDIEKREMENACMEAVNMLRESHRALMENDARMREELSNLKKKYRHDARRWKTNFRDLQQYYNGLRSAPPLVTESELSGGNHSEMMVDSGVGNDDAVRAANELTSTVDELEKRSIAAAWNFNNLDEDETARTKTTVGNINHEDSSYAVKTLSERREALGSLSPIGRRRARGEKTDGGNGDGIDGIDGHRSFDMDTYRSTGGLDFTKEGVERRTDSPAQYLSPAKRRAAEQDALDASTLEHLNIQTLLTSASEKIHGM